MSKAIRIVVHCTATRQGDPITRYGLQHLFFDVNGWHHWGYHAIVYEDGTWEVLQPLPRPTAEGAIITEATRANGAKGFNDTSLHIAYAGGLDAVTGKPRDTRTPMQRETLRVLIATWKQVYHIDQVVGHRDLPGVSKACPCFDAGKEYADV